MSNADEATRILTVNEWPSEFLIYGQVLETGHALGVRPCVFLDRIAGSLVWTVEELKRTRPDISAQRVAQLLGVPVAQAGRILAKS